MKTNREQNNDIISIFIFAFNELKQEKLRISLTCNLLFCVSFYTAVICKGF